MLYLCSWKKSSSESSRCLIQISCLEMWIWSTIVPCWGHHRRSVWLDEHQRVGLTSLFTYYTSALATNYVGCTLLLTLCLSSDVCCRFTNFSSVSKHHCSVQMDPLQIIIWFTLTGWVIKVCVCRLSCFSVLLCKYITYVMYIYYISIYKIYCHMK